MTALRRSSQADEPVIAFMPIKPVYSQRIIAGEKLFEFRRTRIRADLTHIVIYSSSPDRKVVGLAEVKSVLEASPSAIWEKTKHAAGISRQSYREYFDGAKLAIAICLGRVLPLDLEVCPKDVVEGFTVPQSYRYIDESFVERVTELGFDGYAEAV